MELRALAGVQQGANRSLIFWSTHGGSSTRSAIVAPRPGNLSLWGNPHFLGRREWEGGALVLGCSIEAGRDADAERVIDRRSYTALGDITSLDEVSEFWEYEVTQHSRDIRTEGSEDQVALEDTTRIDNGEVARVRPEYVVPKVKYTRESKGLKPKYRIFSRERQQSPKPRINPYSVLMKMIDPANDGEYLDGDSGWQTSEKSKDSPSVARDARATGKGLYDKASSYKGRQELRDETPRDEFTVDTSDLVETMQDTLQQDEALDIEQDGDISLNLKSFDIGEDSDSLPKWHLTSGDGGDEDLDRVLGDIGNSRNVTDELVPSHPQYHSIAQGGDENEVQLSNALLNTEDNVDEQENELVSVYDNGSVRFSDVWSDSDDEDEDEDENDDFGDNEEAMKSGAESVKEETSDGEDPLRKFLSSRSGNRDSKNEGRVFKYNKAARKAVGVSTNRSGLHRAGSLVLGKEILYPYPNPKEKGRLVCRANPEETGRRFNRSNDGVVDLTPIQGSANQIETSAMREVLQIAYNLPKNRVLEDYMAPFMNKFSNIQANLILEALCGDDLTDQVLSFFRWMRLHEPCLWDSRSFSLLFTFLSRMKMPDQALVYFGMLPDYKRFHSVQVYNTLITCLTNCNRQDEVPPILEKMQTWGDEPDAVTFSILMNSAVKGGRSLQEVWTLYQDMVQRGVCPSVTVFGTLIKAFCDVGRLKEALLITTEMEKLNVAFTVVIYNILIDAYGRAGQLEEAEGLVTEMRERGLEPNVGTYNALISSYVEAKPVRQFTVAEGLIEEMEILGLQPDVVTFTALLGAYGHEGMTEQAAQVFSRMEAKGVQPNSYTYTALISAYSAGRWPEKAARAFETMRKRGISATVETFTALLDAYRRAGDIDMVDTVWKTMKKEGCVATRVTYMTILDAFQKQGRFKEARDLIEEFKNQGHKPDLMVYNMLLNAYMRGGRHVKSVDILQEMKAAGFLPDSFTYCTLIYGFLRVRDHTKALKYHREMMSRGQLPDAKTYAKLRAILKVVEGKRDVNNLKSQSGGKKGTEKANAFWKRNK